jgi:tetratricopeptide (TPR) repeat protein
LVLKYVFLLLFLSSIFPSAIRAQEDFQQQLNRVNFLEQKGQYEQAVRIIRTLIDANSSGNGEIGRAWTMLGIAYEQEGHYLQSQNAYEQAIRLLEGDTQHLTQYAGVLDCFAGLNSVMQHPDVANRLWTKALGIHKQLEDHRAMAREYSLLASVEMQRKQLGAAKKALKQAISEARLMNKVDEADAVFLSDTQAWLANLEGESNVELAAYLHSLELRKQIYGVESPLTGWTYLFVGNAYADDKECNQALTNLREGVEILDRTAGQQNPQYVAGEIFYSKVLERCGMHEDAVHLRQRAEQSMAGLLRGECLGCIVSVASLR